MKQLSQTSIFKIIDSKDASLDNLLRKQAELMSFYHKHREWYNESDLNEKLFTFAYAIINECNEFIDGLNWKPWKNKQELDLAYLKEELIDILHFWLTLCLYLKMDAKEIYEIYMKKNKENFRRQKEVREYKVIGEDNGYQD